MAPKGWLACPAFGQLIDNTFLPLKTPVDDDSDPMLEGKEFTPILFAEEMKKNKIDIGLVVNLTNTDKYYQSTDFQDYNIQFMHIYCHGREAPDAKERDQFVKVCNSFLANFPNKMIAVHCTHGFNRTGFMICYYLCSERDWSVDAAVSTFASKRAPGIYKQHYIDELFNIYGDSDDVIMEAPPRPAWEELEETAIQERSNGAITQLEFYEGITDVHLVRDEALKHRIYSRCCELCGYHAGRTGISFPGAQPVSMDLNNLQLLKQKRYRVSWKADGCRYMLYIEDENNIFFLTRSLHLWRVNNIKFPKIEDLKSHLTDTLVDGEMVTDNFSGQKIPRYLIYDVISLNGDIVANHNFDKRCGLIKCVIVEARRKAKSLNILPSEGEPFKVGDKGFFYLHDSAKTWSLKVPHEKDGLIYQPLSSPYTGGTCNDILKWKPPSHNSIDFRLVIREERQSGCIPETYAFLHVNNRADAITKFKLDRDQSHYRLYNNKIVEMTLVNNKWVLMRERKDKLTANSYESASAIFRSIKHPVTEKILFDFVATIPPEPKSSQGKYPSR